MKCGAQNPANWKYKNFVKVDIACQVMKRVRRLSRSSVWMCEFVCVCVTDPEKIAFVGEESVKSASVTLKKRAGADLPTASCQVHSLSVNILPVHDAVIYTRRTSEEGKRCLVNNVLFCFSVSRWLLRGFPNYFLVSFASGEPIPPLVQSSGYYPCWKAIGAKCIPNWIQYDCKIDLLLTNYAFPMQFLTQQCLQ